MDKITEKQVVKNTPDNQNKNAVAPQGRDKLKKQGIYIFGITNCEQYTNDEFIKLPRPAAPEKYKTK